MTPCYVMKDLGRDDYARAGVSNHRILLMTGMNDEERINLLGVDAMTDVVTLRFAKVLQSPRVRKMMRRSLEQYLMDCETMRRKRQAAAYTPAGSHPR